MANHLIHETSAYLLDHAHQPVDWYPWGEAAFAQAQDRDVPILLSIGYSACHWCHVMARESFSDSAIAAQMNESFVNIKVDREVRPDVDALYQAALVAMGVSGGWPLTMFLKPSREPFGGGTYFPPEDRYGRIGFPRVLTIIADTYRDQPEKVEHHAHTLLEALTAMGTPSPAADQPRDPVAAINEVVRLCDKQYGGLVGAPKFPQFGVWRWLALDDGVRGQDRHEGAVCRTLTGLCQGGIFDHLAGGLARYSVDARWLVPHFEKMLYDNAQFIDLLSWAYLFYRKDLYAARLVQTVDWLDKDMRLPGGGFATALDADSLDAQGRLTEGAFYTWSMSEIENALKKDALAFKKAYGVSGTPHLEGRYVLHRRDEALGDADILERLRDVRAQRSHPHRDEKVLTDSNGLTIAALARAGMRMGQESWLAMACTAFDFIIENIDNEERLGHAWTEKGGVIADGLLEDYASMMLAGLALYQTTGDDHYLGHVMRWRTMSEARFWDGRLYLMSDAPELAVKLSQTIDASQPSGNTMMLEALWQLGLLCEDESATQRAHALRDNLINTVQGHPVMVAHLMAVTMAMADEAVVVLAGDHASELVELARTAWQSAVPSLIVAWPGAATGRIPPRFDASSKAAAFVCRRQTCLPPVTTPAALIQALRT
ncbi:MAG: thioredoxin domain-containing protein [Pseudomonadota bacterium]